MVLDVDLIQLYRCKTFEDLTQQTVRLCQLNGVPLLSLTWSPAPGPDAVMIKNAVSIWDNYQDSIGLNGDVLKRALAETMMHALTENRANTKACQAWTLRQRDVFQVFGHAPAAFVLHEHQRHLIEDFTGETWTEFFAVSVCRERDRTLFLTAKTRSLITAQISDTMQRILSTFASAYRFLYIKLGSVHSGELGDEGAGALSSREVECLQWLASGKTLFEAATILGISERTLRYHINNARERLGVATTVQAVVAAALTYGFDPHDARRSICASSRP